ncbi:phosphoribosylaminoimidazole carboxylase catalytic subunit [Escherichia coli]|uniref:Phosphoribosylaminoimidazole carboxylase catalytic subunit n=1 Tax=Escherichia coli TaxID=562 RepID=A0A2X3KFI7_ECOLX|nr:phosphoribosylaminoimidazole carboxylase catalytic subunit [Escherichia coli]
MSRTTLKWFLLTAPPISCSASPKAPEENGYQVIIAGAGGAAHLPGMIAAKTLVPVLGVPVQSAALSGVDSLYSIVTNAARHSGGYAGDW